MNRLFKFLEKDQLHLKQGYKIKQCFKLKKALHPELSLFLKIFCLTLKNFSKLEYNLKIRYTIII